MTIDRRQIFLCTSLSVSPIVLRTRQHGAMHSLHISKSATRVPELSLLFSKDMNKFREIFFSFLWGGRLLVWSFFLFLFPGVEEELRQAPPPPTTQILGGWEQSFRAETVGPGSDICISPLNTSSRSWPGVFTCRLYGFHINRPYRGAGNKGRAAWANWMFVMVKQFRGQL